MTPASLTIDAPAEVESDFSVRAALRSPKRLRIEILAGLVVALALIPEAISFAILAGVDPRVGLLQPSPWLSRSPSSGGAGR